MADVQLSTLGSVIKTAYESQSNTNAFTDTEKSKLAGVASGAEVNTVDSVNSQTGAVVLDADDIDDSITTNKFATAAELSKLSGIEAGATADQSATEIASALDTELVNVRWRATEVPAGGTTNQILAKSSGSDYDVGWITNSGGSGTSWSDPVDSDIVPDGDGTRDLGTSLLRFAEVHCDVLDIGGTLFDGSALSDPGADAIMTWDDSAAAGSEAGWGTYGQGLEQVGSNPQLTDNMMAEAVEFVLDGGGSVLTTGVKGFIEIPFDCDIVACRLLGDQTGSIVVDIWKDTYANYPPTNADSITAAATPTISSAAKYQDTTLTGWTTSITAGDILGFNINSVTTLTRVTVVLKLVRQ